jgi:hypothetical protein
MESRNTSNSPYFEGRIDRKVYSTEDLRSVFDDWDNKTKKEKLKLTRSVDPEEEGISYNVTTDRLHQYFVDNLDPDNSTNTANLSVSHLALGVSDTTPVTSNTDLNDRTYEEVVTDVADNDKELLASTFLDSTEGNGNDFNEIGLFTGNPANVSTADDVFMINHSTFAPVTKDNSKTVTFDVTLQFSDN